MSVSEHAERTGESASRAEAAKVVPGGDETLQKVSGCGGASTSGFCGFVIFAAPETRKCGFGVTVINSLSTKTNGAHRFTAAEDRRGKKSPRTPPRNLDGRRVPATGGGAL